MPRELMVAASHVLSNVRVDEPRFSWWNFPDVSCDDAPGGRSGVTAVPDWGGGHGAPFVLIMVTGLVFHRVPSFQQFYRSVIHKSYGLLNSQCAIITSIFTGMSIRSACVGRWHTVYPGRR